MTTEPSITLLHLSDLQIGPLHRFERGDVLGSLLDRLRQDLDPLREREGLRPDLVLLTGDLSERGFKSEFDDVQRFAEGLAELVGLERRRVVLVPGNHDINRKACEAYFTTCAADEEAPRPPYWPKLRHYADFFAHFYEGQPGICFTEEEPWSFFEYPELKVVVAGLNSTLADSHRAEDHYGFLGEAQIRAFVERLRPYRERGFLRIAAVHHDLLHPPDNNERARQDLKDLKRMLAPCLNVVLHGHLHEEQLEWLDGAVPVPVLGIGSAGIVAAGRPPEVPNQVQVVRVYADRILYGSRAYIPDQKRWVGDVRIDPEGTTWRVEKKVPFDRVEGTFSATTPAEAAPRAELAEWVRRYRSHVAKTYRRQTLFDVAGMAEDAEIPAGLDLLHVFIPQTVVAAPPRMDRPREGELESEGDEAAPWMDAALLKEREALRIELRGGEGPPQPVDEVLGSRMEPWVLILGAPGAGKSALTRWLALKLCTSGESFEPLPADLVPVRVEMHRFDEQYRRAKDAGRSYDFFDYLDDVHRERSLELRRDGLERLAEGGRLLWLFDGLDEVAEPRARCAYAEMIVGLKGRYPGRGMITSRIVGARPVQPLLQQAGVLLYTLQDFDARQIKDFLDRWHELAFPGAPDAGARRRERMRKTLEESRAVRDLCGNPLLVTMIALLNRGGELPRRRHLLYERAVELLAAQWEANKQLPRTAASRFELPDKKRFLRRLAFRMMTELPGGSGNLIRERDLLDFTAAFCRETYGEDPEVAQETARLLVQHLRERNYVLALLGGQAFGFVHKTFLEYLAAAEIHARFRSHAWDLGKVQEIFRTHWRDAAWEEVLTLICGMLEEDRPEHVVGLLQGVLEPIGPFDFVSFGRYLAFAIRCLAEVAQLDQEPVRGFAIALTERMQLGYLNIMGGDLYTALRLCGARWPGREMIHLSARGISSSPLYEMVRGTLYRLMIATATIDQRVPLLVEFGLEADSSFHLLTGGVREAAQHGPWSQAELLVLLVSLNGINEARREELLSALVLTGAESCADELGAIMLSTSDPRIRVNAELRLAGVASWTGRIVDALLDPDRWLNEPDRPMLEEVMVKATKKALNIDPRLLDRFRGAMSSSSSGPLRAAAARALALSGADADAFEIWVNEFLARHTSRSPLVELQVLAPVDPCARTALHRLIDNMNRVDDDRAVAELALALWERDGIRGEAEAGRLLKKISESTPSMDTALFAAGKLCVLPGWASEGCRMLASLADRSPRDFERGNLAVVELRRVLQRDALAQPVLLELAASHPDEQTRLDAASALACAGRADASKQGLEMLRELARSASVEDNRLCAARFLRDAGAPPKDWQETLTELAHQASDDLIRFEAGKALADRALLITLAEQTQNPLVLYQIQHVLEILRVHRALLQIGRRRRGRVSLDGVPVGHIEETAYGTRFTYDRAYLHLDPPAIPISPTLPLREAPYESQSLHPFFENLLPEGWLLDLTCRKLGLDRTDAFGLLLATCADCAGAVEVTPEQQAA